MPSIHSESYGRPKCQYQELCYLSKVEPNSDLDDEYNMPESIPGGYKRLLSIRSLILLDLGGFLKEIYRRLCGTVPHKEMMVVSRKLK